MYENFYFFNRYGNGDILNSKEYVRELAIRLPAEGIAKKVWYLHPKSHQILWDMDDILEQSSVTEKCNNALPFVEHGDDVYFNTWIGRDGRYVLPGIVCTDIMNFKMFNDQLRAMGLSVQLERPLIDYVPQIDFDKMDTRYKLRINRFFQIMAGRKVMLVCNGDVHSNQATNFDFGPIINALCERHPDEVFVATTEYAPAQEYHNLFFTRQLIHTDEGFDLNEIAYLSNRVDLTVGRASGPSVFAQHKENILDPSKKFLVFSNHPDCVTFLKGAKGDATFFWSGETTKEPVYQEIREVMEWKT
jgi:hypothetical protein